MTNTINKRKNSIDLSDVIHNIRKNSTDSIDSRSYSTDENTPRTPRRSNSIEIKIDISNNETNLNITNKISIPKKRRIRDRELYIIPASPPKVEYLKQILPIYKQE